LNLDDTLLNSAPMLNPSKFARYNDADCGMNIADLVARMNDNA